MFLEGDDELGTHLISAVSKVSDSSFVYFRRPYWAEGACFIKGCKEDLLLVALTDMNDELYAPSHGLFESDV